MLYYTILDTRRQVEYTDLIVPMRTIAKQIHAELLKAKNILIISHKNPDGDTLACACAMMQYLRGLGKNHTAFCATAINKNIAFLPHIEYFIIDPTIFQRERFDLIIVFDSGDLIYAGVAEHLKNLPYNPTIVNIDHHPTNEMYGHFNLVSPEAASTTEILHRFFKINHLPIDKYIATALLTGIITDTTHFTNPATSAQSLKIASELLRAGANFNLIRGWTLKNKKIAALKIWGKVLSRLYKNEEYDMAITVLTREDMAEFNLPDEEVDGLSNFLNHLGEAKITLLLREKEDDTIKASLRTTDTEVDVSKIALAFGGGGHAKAAGFSVKGKLAEEKGEWKVV